MRPRAMALAALISLAAALSAGCGAGLSGQPTPTPLPVVQDLTGITAEGRLEPIRFVTIAPASPGLVSEVLAAQGDSVEAGQVIARLDSSDTQTLEAARARAALELSSAYEAVRAAQSALDDYPLPREFVGMTAEQAARTWLDRLDTARTDFQPYEDMSRKTLKPNRIYPHMPRRVLFDTGEYNDKMAKEYKKHLDVAWMNYTKAVQWVTLDSNLQLAKARLAEAERSHRSVQDPAFALGTAGPRAALASAELRAPYAGTITNLDLKVGELASAGMAAVTIADLSSWVVKTTDLTEIDVIDVHPNQAVSITLDAVPGATLDGRVLSVAQNYTQRQGDIVYVATILVADRLPEMRWGMTAQTNFGQ